MEEISLVVVYVSLVKKKKIFYLNLFYMALIDIFIDTWMSAFRNICFYCNVYCIETKMNWKQKVEMK